MVEDLWAAFSVLEAARGEGFHIMFSLFELPAFVQNLFSDGDSKCTTGILDLQSRKTVCEVLKYVQQFCMFSLSSVLSVTLI